MKIVHISHEYDPTISGVRQVVQELAERQVRAGHEVHVFTSDWDKKKRIKKKSEVINGVHVTRFTHIAKVGTFSNIWPSFFSKLVKEDFDIIHSHVFGHLHFVLASIAATIKGIPHIHTTHCPWTNAHRPTLSRIGVFISYNIFSRIALKFTDKIIAITPWEVNFIKRFGGNEKKISVIPNGMDNSFFIKIKNNSFKKKYKIKDMLVLFFGRLNVTKGPEKFVETAHLVLKERPNTTFVIRGPDEGMKDEVKKKIGDEKRIILLQETRDRKEIVEMYQAADIFVLPSFREGLPLTLFEAMAAGLPIVASPVNGVPYEMKEPDNGFLVDYGNNQNFAKKIINFLDDKKLREKVSKNNIEKSKNYKWDIISEKILKLYEKLIKNK